MKRKNKKREARVHQSICKYIEAQYPKVIYHSDASGIRLTMGQAVAIKKLTKAREKIPDLFLAEPIGTFSGLYLEIKQSKEVLYKKDGKRRKSKHFDEQAETLNKLFTKGYAAYFAAGFDEAKQIIDSYMAGAIIQIPF